MSADFPTRVQWCHGAPGLIAGLADLPRDDELDALLAQAGELVWLAGPLVKRDDRQPDATSSRSTVARGTIVARARPDLRRPCPRACRPRREQSVALDRRDRRRALSSTPASTARDARARRPLTRSGPPGGLPGHVALVHASPHRRPLLRRDVVVGEPEVVDHDLPPVVPVARSRLSIPSGRITEQTQPRRISTPPSTRRCAVT